MSQAARDVAQKAREVTWRANAVHEPPDTELINCLCGSMHPPLYAGRGTANDPIILDPINRKHPTCATSTTRMAEAEREHTLALICKKIKEQQSGSSSGN